MVMVLVSNSESKTICFYSLCLGLGLPSFKSDKTMKLYSWSLSLFPRSWSYLTWDPRIYGLELRLKNLWSWPCWTQTRPRLRPQILQSEFKSMYSWSMHGPTRPRPLTGTQGHILVLVSGAYWLVLTWTQQSSGLVCSFREFRVCKLHIFKFN